MLIRQIPLPKSHPNKTKDQKLRDYEKLVTTIAGLTVQQCNLFAYQVPAGVPTALKAEHLMADVIQVLTELKDSL